MLLSVPVPVGHTVAVGAAEDATALPLLLRVTEADGVVLRDTEGDGELLLERGAVADSVGVRVALALPLPLLEAESHPLPLLLAVCLALTEGEAERLRVMVGERVPLTLPVPVEHTDAVGAAEDATALPVTLPVTDGESVLLWLSTGDGDTVGECEGRADLELLLLLEVQAVRLGLGEGLRVAAGEPEEVRVTEAEGELLWNTEREGETVGESVARGLLDALLEPDEQAVTLGLTDGLRDDGGDPEAVRVIAGEEEPL